MTSALIDRLRNAMANAGCNDVCRDEFPDSVCSDFRSDYEVLDAWERFHDKAVPPATGGGG